MTGRLLYAFKQRIASIKLVPAGGGCFEIAFDGELVFSKLQTDEFPDEVAIEALLRARLKLAPKTP